MYQVDIIKQQILSAVEQNEQARTEAQSERQRMQETLAENKRMDQEQVAKQRDQTYAYRTDLRGQVS